MDTLKGSKHANMKELRFDADDGVWRIAFAFDLRRHAVLLVGGDKSGGSEKRFTSGSSPRRISGSIFILRGSNHDSGGSDMGSTLDRKIAQLPAKRRARVKTRAAELIAEELSLQDLRKAMNRTQAEIAKALNVGQDTVSRYERRTDMLLSTLRGYVRAMGGELELVARFPNRQPVRIKALRDLAVDARARRAG